MFKQIDQPNWEKLYKVWKYSCNHINTLITETVRIVEIEVDDPGWDWRGNDYIDWWPNELFDSLKDTVDKDGIRVIINGKEQKSVHA